ncbi:GNAT family N-acetyltransferase [Massilia sp. W12]|uniref:GNAT family N-acetyltransferase n=1 Tax=Massilia sp. W12 TaxID=3126507 RepID=UPI0030D44B55
MLKQQWRISQEAPDLSQRGAVRALWQRSFEERGGSGLPGPEVWAGMRFLLLEQQGELCGMAALNLPQAPHGRFKFESATGFPLRVMPQAGRDEIAEGLALYVAPECRRQGCTLLLTALTLLQAHQAGRRWFVAENSGGSLKMALAAGFEDSGVVTRMRNQVEVKLCIGALDDVLLPACAAVQNSAIGIELSPPLQALWRGAEQRFLQAA